MRSRLLCVLCQQEDWGSATFPYSLSLEVLLLRLGPLLQSDCAQVRRYVAQALPTLAGHLPSFRHSSDLTSWVPLLMDSDREVKAHSFG